ncbi:hypothetical protein MIR68_004800 [Amoeboaphelidium protococcarum]|nr:hypothetical protein MIR68_004800 [Amoeboaphelidium protococcarum]
MSVPFIGSEITLISKSEIKYVGVLIEINQNESTVTLQNVRSFGSEGRRQQFGLGSKEIPPSDKVFEFIVFRGQDIKDLQVTKSSGVQNQQLEDKEEIYQDPAVVQAGQGSKSLSHQQNGGDRFGSKTDGNNVYKPAATHSTTKQSQQQQQQSRQRYNSNKSSGSGDRNQSSSTSRKQNGDYAAKARDQKSRSTPGKSYRNNQQQLPQKVEIPNEDFDFTKAIVDKLKIAQELADGGQDVQSFQIEQRASGEQRQPPKYDKKSSFFDEISSDAQERFKTLEERQKAKEAANQDGNGDIGHGNVGSMSREERYQKRREQRQLENQLNMETFGIAYDPDGHSRNFRGRGGRGRYNKSRGGRGGYSRGGRGKSNVANE